MLADSRGIELLRTLRPGNSLDETPRRWPKGLLASSKPAVPMSDLSITCHVEKKSQK
jgi:hypothetical protein